MMRMRRVRKGKICRIDVENSMQYAVGVGSTVQSVRSVLDQHYTSRIASW